MNDSFSLFFCLFELFFFLLFVLLLFFEKLSDELKSAFIVTM